MSTTAEASGAAPISTAAEASGAASISTVRQSQATSPWPITVPAQRHHPHRFRLSRAGIHQVWQYDDEFCFGDGRLLLRGKNGAGKSKALEVLLPFLLDGDTRKLDAAGGGKTTLKWLMLDGWSAAR